MFLTEQQIKDVAKLSFEDYETHISKAWGSPVETWDNLVVAHRDAWIETTVRALKFAMPLIEAAIHAETEEIFSGLFAGMIEARRLRREQEDASVDAQ